jgi:glyoxylase-like metal-dependent hydrolase (beta-lactamase superfamily II)
VSRTPDRFERFGANLWRWTTPHPLWTPKEADHTGGWPQDVGSMIYVRDGTATILDPQAGEDDADLWAFLDARTAGAERVAVALTASWHLRSSVAVLDRYGGELRLHRQAAGDSVMRGLERVRPFETDGEVAPGVEALLIGGLVNGEVLYWLPEHGALVSGEVFHGRPDGLRIAPDPYAASLDDLYAWLRALDRLPVRLVLPTHGPPAPDGPGVVRDALARPPWRLFGSG